MLRSKKPGAVTRIRTIVPPPSIGGNQLIHTNVMPPPPDNHGLSKYLCVKLNKISHLFMELKSLCYLRDDMKEEYREFTSRDFPDNDDSEIDWVIDEKRAFYEDEIEYIRDRIREVAYMVSVYKIQVQHPPPAEPTAVAKFALHTENVFIMEKVVQKFHQSVAIYQMHQLKRVQEQFAKRQKALERFKKLTAETPEKPCYPLNPQVKRTSTSQMKRGSTSQVKSTSTSKGKRGAIFTMKQTSTLKVKADSTSHVKPSTTSLLKPSKASQVKQNSTANVKPDSTSNMKLPIISCIELPSTSRLALPLISQMELPSTSHMELPSISYMKLPSFSKMKPESTLHIRPLSTADAETKPELLSVLNQELAENNLSVDERLEVFHELEETIKELGQMMDREEQEDDLRKLPSWTCTMFVKRQIDLHYYEQRYLLTWLSKIAPCKSSAMTAKAVGTLFYKPNDAQPILLFNVNYNTTICYPKFTCGTADEYQNQQEFFPDKYVITKPIGVLVDDDISQIIGQQLGTPINHPNNLIDFYAREQLILELPVYIIGSMDKARRNIYLTLHHLKYGHFPPKAYAYVSAIQKSLDLLLEFPYYTFGTKRMPKEDNFELIEMVNSEFGKLKK